MRFRPRRGVVLSACLALAAGAALPSLVSAHPAPRVLRVGTYDGIPGQYTSVQAAVRHTRPGDWVLVAPGDYKEHGYRGEVEPAGVLIRTPWVHLRGMNRNTVIIDGTKPGTPACSARRQDQRITANGLDGVEAYKADGDYIENLTVCNYLTGPKGGEGNEIWWNGGDSSGKIAMGPWWGNYITATSTYSDGVNMPFGDYGIFVSNARGPGFVDHSYANNMGDAAYYIGACPDCNAELIHAHGETSSLGYSGTNSGGHLIIRDSEFDNNKSGPTTNSQNNDDAPSPQVGLCPNDAPGPFRNGICDIWMNNYVHDNNNPNVPGNSTNGLAGAGPVGAGIILAGTEYVELYHNRVVRNNSWGILVADLPDVENPPTQVGQNCQGGISVIPPNTVPSNPAGIGTTCYFQAFGNVVADNFFEDNGSYGNPTNGDLAMFTLPHAPGNCFYRNYDPKGLSTDPVALQSFPYNPCGNPNGGDVTVGLVEGLCATQLVAPCPYAPVPGVNYPHAAAHFTLHMPKPQPTMPNPCQGVPANPWCPSSGSGGGWSLVGVFTGAGGPPLVLGALTMLAAGGWLLGRRRVVVPAPALAR